MQPFSAHVPAECTEERWGRFARPYGHDALAQSRLTATQNAAFAEDHWPWHRRSRTPPPRWTFIPINIHTRLLQGAQHVKCPALFSGCPFRATSGQCSFTCLETRPKGEPWTGLEELLLHALVSIGLAVQPCGAVGSASCSGSGSSLGLKGDVLSLFSHQVPGTNPGYRR